MTRSYGVDDGQEDGDGVDDGMVHRANCNWESSDDVEVSHRFFLVL